MHDLGTSSAAISIDRLSDSRMSCDALVQECSTDLEAMAFRSYSASLCQCHVWGRRDSEVYGLEQNLFSN
jgi:hypothetical protein